MSGRGGRGGRRGGRAFMPPKKAPPGMPFGDDPTLVVNDKPQETYPKTYKPPAAIPFSASEERSVACFVRFRRDFHNSRLYTHPHLDTETKSPTAPVLRTYEQAQVNSRYGVKSRATADPFHAVDMYSHRFVDERRTLPELKGHGHLVKDMFPEELWATLDGKDTGGPRGGFPVKGKTVVKRGLKRKVAATAAHDDDNDEAAAFGEDEDDDDILNPKSRRVRRRNHKDMTEEERKAMIEAAIKDGDNNNEEMVEADVELEEEEEEMSQQDDDYDDADQSGGDYDAEKYFDDGDADDFGDDEGGVGESAMDF